MRVMIAASVSPFTGREEMHWAQAIARRLAEKKIEADLFMLPVVQNPLLIPEQMTALRFLDINNRSDLLLTIGFPAFVLKHSSKRVLLFSLAPSLHEHYDTEYGILATPQYHRTRLAVKNAEKNCLLEAERIVCASGKLAAQLDMDLNIKSTSMILGDSLEKQDTIQFTDAGPWVVCESMLEPSERIDLLLYAMTYSSQNWRLLICVPASSAVYRQAIENRILRLGLKERVVINNGRITTDVLGKSHAYIALHFASTRIPESALRALKTSVPIVTASDCGALLEIVTHNANGLVVDPDAKAISLSLDRIVSNEEVTEFQRFGNQSTPKLISDVTEVTERLIG